MKLLITGCNGFLGQHIKNNLTISYLAPTSSELNLLNFDNLLKYLQKNKPNIILHMAALCGGILANKNRSADFLRDNTQMAINIYEASRLSNVEYIYSLGSVCAYPKFCKIPFKEDDIWNGAPEETNLPYGQAKRTLLTLNQTYRQQYGIKGLHLIPVNLYGEYDHFNLIDSHVIPALIVKFHNAIKNNLPYIECWGTGYATREFLYAGDAAQIIIKSVLNIIDYHLPINLGTGQEISIKKLTLMMKKIFNYSGEIIFNGSVSDGQPRRVLDISRAKQVLVWEAKTSLENGLIKTINWFKYNE